MIEMFQRKKNRTAVCTVFPLSGSCRLHSEPNSVEVLTLR